MKKTILSLIALLGISLMMQAQTKMTSPSKHPKTATDKMHNAAMPADKKATVSTATVKKEAAVKAMTADKKTTAAVKTAANPTKKDGTADMRFKANKEKATGPVKKDGTPDKRYKANKPKN